MKYFTILAVLVLMAGSVSADWITPLNHTFGCCANPWDYNKTYDQRLGTGWNDLEDETGKNIQYDLGKNYNISNIKIYAHNDGDDGNLCRITGFAMCNQSGMVWSDPASECDLFDFIEDWNIDGSDLFEWHIGNKRDEGYFRTGRFVHLYGIHNVDGFFCNYIGSPMTLFNEVEIEVFQLNGETCQDDLNCSSNNCAGGICGGVTTTTIVTTTTTTTTLSTTSTTTTLILYEKDTLWTPINSPANYTLAKNKTFEYGISVEDNYLLIELLNMTVNDGIGNINISDLTQTFLNYTPSNLGNMTLCHLVSAHNYGVFQEGVGTLVPAVTPTEQGCIDFNWTTPDTLITVSITGITTTTTTTTTTSTTLEPDTWLDQIYQRIDDLTLWFMKDTETCQILIDNDADFSSVDVNRHVWVTDYTHDEYLSSGVYYWKVRCRKNNRFTMWSEVWNFNNTLDTTQIYFDWTIKGGPQ